MKIHMHLFCLIGALATGITDGRISSSSSSSSSSSQPVDGSAMEVTPNRRDSETHYCTAKDSEDGGDGKRRGVVDWQGNDGCNKCEGGQLWWPCAGGDLCTGACTPEEVCDVRYAEKVAVLKEQIGELEKAERSIFQEHELLIASLHGELKELKTNITNLETILASTTSPIASPIALPIASPTIKTPASDKPPYKFAYEAYYNRPSVNTTTSVTSTGQCTSIARNPDNPNYRFAIDGGDCSRTPTFCSSVGSLQERKASLNWEIEMIQDDIELIESEIQDLGQLQGETPDTDKNIVDCVCASDRNGGQSWKQVCSVPSGGICAYANSCLNLDFVCSVGSICEISCLRNNSCNGLTMYCADKQRCAIKDCGDGTEKCVGAKVVYNGIEYGVQQGSFWY